MTSTPKRRYSGPQHMYDGTQMERRLRDFHWSQTQLGHYENWPQILRLTVNIMLSSQQPMWIGWGPELIFLYNDAYIPILGEEKHPWALGQPAKLVWEEMWDVCGPLTEKVKKGKSVFLANVCLFNRRTDYLEESYFSFSFSSIRDDSGNVVGLFCASTVTTPYVLSERRLKTHSELSAKSLLEKSIDSTCDAAIEILSHNREDIPFALLYLFDHQKGIAKLKMSFGISGEKPHLNSPLVHLSDSNKNCNNNNNHHHQQNFFWPITEVYNSGKSKFISVGELNDLPLGMADQKIKLAIVQPLCIPNSTNPIGVLITGVNPCLSLSNEFLSFFELVAGQISTAMYNAKTFEDEKKRMEMLAEIDRAKTIFFSNVSHELRTPVTLILSPVEELLSDSKNSLNQDQKDKLQLISRNSHRLLKLINSLLDFSKIEAKKMQGKFEEVDLPAFTSDLASIFKSTMERAKLDYIIDIPSFDNDEKVYVDRDMWEKIVFNLLSNAFKFTLEGKVKISLRKDKKFAILKVKDTGLGIPESDIPFLFERFRRVEGTQGRSIEGTGIGLALIHELIKLHGGNIQIKSNLGKGTTFTVSIPFGSDHLPPDQIVKKNELISNEDLPSQYVIEASRWIPEDDVFDTKSITDLPESTHISRPNRSVDSLHSRILLVDDNADMRQYVRSLLEREPFCREVIAVGNGEDALRVAVTKIPDIIITDVMMPKLDGFGLLKALRENVLTQSIPIIILSALTKEDDRIKGLQAGADDYLSKPFSAKELITRVESHLKITQIRKAAFLREKELTNVANSARKNLEDVMKNIKEGFLVLNQDWEVIYLNNTMEEVFNVAKKDIMGKNYFEFFPYQVGTKLEEDFKLAKEKKVLVIDEVFCITLHQWFEIRVSPHSDGICIFASNITRRKQLESDKQQAIELANKHQQRRIQEAEDYKRKQGEFIDTLCHELRNPLNGIYGGLSLIQSDVKNINEILESPLDSIKLKEKIQSILKTMSKTIFSMEACAKQQKVIVDDVLDLSKLDNNKVELNPVPFKISTIISSVIQMFHPQILEKKLNITTKIDENYVKADPHRLTQIITNLISNAVKFTNIGEIKVEAVLESTSESEQYLKVVVGDTGIGMNLDEQLRIFNRFAQANRRTSTEFGGSGLGLAISKTLVEAMGGTISVSSEKGKGTEFTFTIRCFDLTDEEKKKLNIDTQSSEQTMSLESTSNRRDPADVSILIVEDNRFNYKIICRLLDQKGFTNHSVATNGKEALELLNEKSFDIIFMDVEMPVLNGIEATKLIREKERLSKAARQIPIIGISGNVSQKQVQCGLDSGMNDYLKKPYERSQIFQIIEKYVLSVPKIVVN